MSRITKEEIEKTKCGRFLLSDENIYLSIYSLNSYVFEYNLLNTEDRILYHRLQDKFDARLINRVITRVLINQKVEFYVLHILIGRQTSLRKIWKMLILQ